MKLAHEAQRAAEYAARNTEPEYPNLEPADEFTNLCRAHAALLAERAELRACLTDCEAALRECSPFIYRAAYPKATPHPRNKADALELLPRMPVKYPDGPGHGPDAGRGDNPADRARALLARTGEPKG